MACMRTTYREAWEYDMSDSRQAVCRYRRVIHKKGEVRRKDKARMNMKGWHTWGTDKGEKACLMKLSVERKVSPPCRPLSHKRI